MRAATDRQARRAVPAKDSWCLFPANYTFLSDAKVALLMQRSIVATGGGMNVLKLLCLPVFCFALASCGGSSSKTSGMSLADFEAKLEAMKTRFEEPCTACKRTGKVPDPERETQVACTECSGTGTRKGVRGPTLAEFRAAVGEPDREEGKPGDPIWEYWHYRCREGTARLPVYLDEEEGDEIRVVTGEPELLNY